MKALVPILLIIVVVGGIMYFNSTKKNTDNQLLTDIPEATGEKVSKDFEGTFIFDNGASTATWTGSKKIIKDYFDSGSIKIKSGFAVFKKGMIESGEIVFDMTSVSGTTTSNTKAPVSKLSEHLKSEDFFEVTKYPEAKYVVTSSEKTGDGYTLVGDLTVKGETHPLTVPVKTAMENGNAMIVGTVIVDRSVWNVQYGSETFFDNLGDNVINNEFKLEFSIVARP